MEVITTAAYAMKDYEIEMLAKSFLPEIRTFFESKEGRAEYEKQVAEQKIKNVKFILLYSLKYSFVKFFAKNKILRFKSLKFLKIYAILLVT